MLRSKSGKAHKGSRVRQLNKLKEKLAQKTVESVGDKAELAAREAEIAQLNASAKEQSGQMKEMDKNLWASARLTESALKDRRAAKVCLAQSQQQTIAVQGLLVESIASNKRSEAGLKQRAEEAEERLRIFKEQI